MFWACIELVLLWCGARCTSISAACHAGRDLSWSNSIQTLVFVMYGHLFINSGIFRVPFHYYVLFAYFKFRSPILSRQIESYCRCLLTSFFSSLFSDSGTDQAHDDGIGTSDDETNSNSSSTESKSEELSSSPNMAQSRRVIKLDLAAMSQLLAFDEVS